MRIKLTFSYDGCKFNGFQRQKNARSVQGTIEEALSKIYGEKIEIKGSGRTDAGVHANAQVAHYDNTKKVKNLEKRINDLVLPDIVVKSAIVVKDDFHARLSVKKKEYIYKINLGPFQHALTNYYLQPNYKLDISLMRTAAKYMLGKHDFHNFVAGEREDYTTTINSITFNKRFNKLEIRFVGTGFYRYMVRNLVGALLEVGKCKVPIYEIENMISLPNIEKRLPTAEAEGLYLNRIWY